MKHLACLILMIFTVLHAQADNWLTNGDFSDGNSHWYGDPKWPTDFAPPDPFTKADPFTSQGMIMVLHPDRWMKAFQDFKGKGADCILKISYQLSPGLTFSTKPEDYQNMPDKIGWDAWESFNTPPNAWVVFVSEIEQGHGEYRIMQPEIGSTQEQTIMLPLKGLTPWSQKTIALAFPPGNGTLVIHKIEIVDP